MDAVACLDDRETGWVGGPSLPLRTSARVGPLARTTCSAAEQPSQIRIERVLAVRDRLAEGSYSITERLDAVLDRILEDLLQE